MDDHIITIGDSNGFDGWRWKMTIDLKELAVSAGVRKKEPDGVYTDPRTGETEVYKGSYYTDYPMRKARKLLKLIHEHCTDPEIVGKYLAPNKKLYEYWRSL